MRLSLGLLLADDYSCSELTELGALAETLGYDSFWFVDVRLAHECYIGLASIATRTGRIRLGTGVTDPYSRHPAVTAASIATLDELSGGRAILGLGLGGSGFKELGMYHQARVLQALLGTLDHARSSNQDESVAAADAHVADGYFSCLHAPASSPGTHEPRGSFAECQSKDKAFKTKDLVKSLHPESTCAFSAHPRIRRTMKALGTMR